MAKGTCLASDKKQLSHSKASFLAIASQTLRSHLQKSNKVFQAYFLALFPDKQYTQILDRILKEDKSLRSYPTQPVRAVVQHLPGSSGREFSRLQHLVCFDCGIPGHRQIDVFVVGSLLITTYFIPSVVVAVISTSLVPDISCISL